MRYSKKLAQDTIMAFLASIVNTVVLFIIVFFIGRLLGASQLGLYRMSLTLFEVMVLLAAVGIPGGLVKFAAENRDDKLRLRQIATSSLTCLGFFGLIGGILFSIASGYLGRVFDMPGLDTILLFLAVALPFMLVAEGSFSLLNGLRKMRQYCYLRIVQDLSRALLTITLIIIGFGVGGAIAAFTISLALTAAVLLYSTKKDIGFNLGGLKENSVSLVRFGLPILGSGAINMVQYRLDIILIGYLLTSTQVGYYALAIGIARFLWIIPRSIQRMTYPVTSEYWSRKKTGSIKKLVDKSAKYTACILTPIGLMFFVFSEPVIPFVFGSEFIYSLNSLHILLIGVVAYGVSMSVGACVTAAGRPDIGFRMVVYTSSMNLVLNMLLIPLYGIEGAAFATSASLTTTSILVFYYIRQIMDVKSDVKWFANFVLLTVFTSASLLVSKNEWSLVISLFIVFLYSFFLARSFLDEEDRQYFMGLWIGLKKHGLKAFV